MPQQITEKVLGFGIFNPHPTSPHLTLKALLSTCLNLETQIFVHLKLQAERANLSSQYTTANLDKMWKLRLALNLLVTMFNRIFKTFQNDCFLGWIQVSCTVPSCLDLCASAQPLTSSRSRCKKKLYSFQRWFKKGLPNWNRLFITLYCLESITLFFMTQYVIKTLFLSSF